MRIHKDDELPSIDMTPMIDCVFLLLIFFLVAATIRKKHNELPIDLPSSGNAVVKKAKDNTIIISIVKAKGNDVLYAFSTMGDTMTTTGGAREMKTLQQLVTSIKEAAVSDPNRKARIDADQGVPWGKVSQVIDHLEMYQIRRIGFRTSDNTSSSGGG